jgi:hypothetical protein
MIEIRDEQRFMSQPLNSRGWWEQHGYGRQSMDPLRVELRGDRLSGVGVDVIGPFRLDRRIDRGGKAEILKQYIGQHQVLYVGRYDGEGTFSGQWSVGGDAGTWLIFVGSSSRDMDRPITDITGDPPS